MVKVSMADPGFHQAYWNAVRALPVITLEQPRQYFQRWRETYRCKVLKTDVIFDNDEDYTWFMLRWG